MSVRGKVKRRPVRVASVILAVLLYVLTVIPGDEPPVVIQLVTLLAPIIAGFITERFTFSQAFLKELMRLIPNDGNAARFAAGQDDRLDTNSPSRRDAGLTMTQVVAIIALVGVVLLALLMLNDPGPGR